MLLFSCLYVLPVTVLLSVHAALILFCNLFSVHAAMLLFCYLYMLPCYSFFLDMLSCYYSVTFIFYQIAMLIVCDLYMLPCY